MLRPTEFVAFSITRYLAMTIWFIALNSCVLHRMFVADEKCRSYYTCTVLLFLSRVRRCTKTLLYTKVFLRGLLIYDQWSNTCNCYRAFWSLLGSRYVYEHWCVKISCCCNEIHIVVIGVTVETMLSYCTKKVQFLTYSYVEIIIYRSYDKMV